MKYTTRLACVLCVLLTSAPWPLDADERDERLRALEKRVEELEKLLKAQDAKPTPAPATAAASSPAPAPEPPKPAPSLSVGASGVTIRSADSNFVFRLRGLLQVDSHWSNDDAVDDSFVLRRARPILAGTVFRDFDFRFTPEFAGSTPSIRDAWINYHYEDCAQLRVGKMKAPGALERAQSVSDIPFIERSFVSMLWPVRELGVLVHGELWPGDERTTKTLGWDGLVNYGAGIFNGAGDGRAAANSDFDNNKSASGLLFFHPFLRTGVAPLRKFGLGVSGTYGQMEGDAGLPDDFDYADDVVADGTYWRVGPQAYWYWGPFGLQGEYTISSQHLEREAAPFTSVTAANRAWMVTASWLLTGEEGTFRTLTPRKNFDPRAGGWGAWQLVARYTYLDLDDDLFPDFADPTELPTRAASWGLGLNWFLNQNIRASFNFTHTDFKGGQSGNIADLGENVFWTRLQLSF